MKIRLLAPAVLLASLTAVTPSSAAQWHPPTTTVAGSNGQGSDANQLSGPYAVTLDSDGVLYVVDTNNHRVQAIEFTDGSAGAPTTVAGGNGPGSTPDRLYTPRGVFIGPDGAVYTSDHSNHRVQRQTVRSDGSLNQATTIAGGLGQGDGPSQLQFPYGVVLADDGSLYIADTGNHRVQRVTFDSNGVPNEPTTIAGGNGEGSRIDQLSYPRGLAVAPDGSILIADERNHRVQRVVFKADGTPKWTTTVYGGIGAGSGANQFYNPYDVAFDEEGSFYVVDSGNHRVQKISFDKSGSPLEAITVFGNSEGSGDDQLSSPRSIAIGKNGVAYIADQGNHRVQQITLDVARPTAQAKPSTVRVGDSATVGFNCTDTGGSGVNTCTATLDGQPISNGDPLNTSARSTHTLVVKATDNAGNTTTETTDLKVHGKRELTGTYTAAAARPGAVARLYMATFNREPEIDGFTFWTNSTNALQATANFFATSPEFVGLYGNTTNTEFVDLIYTNVLVRDPEPAGHAYWLTQLDDGMTQAQMLLWFSESPEFRTSTYTS